MTFGLFNSYTNRPLREDTTPETWNNRSSSCVVHCFKTPTPPSRSRYRVPWSSEDKYEPNKCSEIKGQWGLRVLSSLSELCNVNNMPTQYPYIHLSSIYVRFSF